MADKPIHAFPNANAPSRPVIFNPEICTGCNKCVEECPVDVYMPNPNRGGTPIIMHADECWYCGTCVNDCPSPGAIKLNWPLQQRGYWKRKASNQIFRV